MVTTGLVLKCLAALALLVLSMIVAYGLSSRLFPESRVSERFCATGVVWHWVLVFSFFALASLGLFKIEAALALFFCLAMLVFAGVCSPAVLAEMASRDGGTVCVRLSQALHSKEGVFYGAGLGTLGISLFRGVILPPVTWDSLTYHLFYAGNWVQRGGFFSMAAPDFWNAIYQYFPTNAEVVFAWFMLPFHGDQMVNLANVPAWLTGLAAFYCLSRQLGVTPRVAALGSLLLGFNPIVFAYLNSGYVEIMLLSHFLAGACFLGKGIEENHHPSLLLAAGSLGNALGCKLVAGPAACLGFLILVVAPFILSGDRKRAFGTAFGAVFLFLVICLPAYSRGWSEHRSFSYPYELKIAGMTIFKGSTLGTDGDSQQEIPSKFTRESTSSAQVPYSRLFFPPSLAVGQTGLLAFLLCPFGFFFLFRRGAILFPAFLFCAAGLSLLGFFSSQMKPALVHGIASSSRYLGIPFGILLLVSVFLLHALKERGGKIESLLLLSLAIDLFLALPTTWDTGWWDLNLALKGIVGVCTVAVVLLPDPFPPSRWVSPKGLPFRVLGGVLLFLILVFLLGVKQRDRYLFFQGAYEIHALRREAVPAWQACDVAEKPLNIAVSAGWDRLGHNWWWYPLMGSHLQNSIHYIPVTRSGEIVDTWNPTRIASEADFSSWMARLVEKKIDTLVLLPENPPEFPWVQQHPEIFHPLYTSESPLAFSVTPPNDLRPSKDER